MTLEHYILKSDGSIEIVSLMEWAKWFEESKDRFVKQDKVNGFFVSTVFLGLDHNFTDSGAPILFETMVFDENRKNDYGSHPDIYSERFRTKEEAILNHDKLVADLKEGKDISNYE